MERRADLGRRLHVRRRAVRTTGLRLRPDRARSDRARCRSIGRRRATRKHTLAERRIKRLAARRRHSLLNIEARAGRAGPAPDGCARPHARKRCPRLAREALTRRARTSTRPTRDVQGRRRPGLPQVLLPTPRTGRGSAGRAPLVEPECAVAHPLPLRRVCAVPDPVPSSPPSARCAEIVLATERCAPSSSSAAKAIKVSSGGIGRTRRSAAAGPGGDPCQPWKFGRRTGEQRVHSASSRRGPSLGLGVRPFASCHSRTSAIRSRSSAIWSRSLASRSRWSAARSRSSARRSRSSR